MVETTPEQAAGSTAAERHAVVRGSTVIDRLAKIELMQARLRSALSEWADDGPLLARLQELEREAERLRERRRIERPASLALGSR
jgi:hypothetical protein